MESFLYPVAFFPLKRDFTAAIVETVVSILLRMIEEAGSLPNHLP